MSATKHSFTLPYGAAYSGFRFVKFDFQRKIHANVHSFSVMRTVIYGSLKNKSTEKRKNLNLNSKNLKDV
jgi:hypothetical protein